MGEGQGQANGFDLLALLHRVDPLFPQKLCITSSDTDDLGMFKLNLRPSWFNCQPIGASSFRNSLAFTPVDAEPLRRAHV